METGLEKFGLGVACTLFLGIQLQTMGARMNTPLKFVDLLLNISVIVFFLYTLRHFRDHPLLVGGLGIWAFKSYANIFPLLRLFANYMNLEELTDRHIVSIADTTHNDYTIEGFHPLDIPCVYVANHGMGSLDDILAMGTMTGERISVVSNRSPGGLRGVERGRERMCVLPEGANRYEATRRIVEEEVVGKKRSLVVYPENMGKKKNSGDLAPFRSGIFKICWEGGIPVVPLWIEWPSPFPSIFRDTRKILRVATGIPLFPNHFSTPDKFRGAAWKGVGSLKGVHIPRREIKNYLCPSGKSQKRR
jgi:1-acyl-sn-glycerol-3-phosphate acyltransferase